MFSGIVQGQGRIVATEMRGVNLRVTVAIPRGWKFSVGESAAIDGICTTIVVAGRGTIQADYMPETLSMTTASDFAKGRSVNLERSTRTGDPIHGHFVQGHVDAVGIVENVKDNEFSIRVPGTVSRYVAHKGSIAVNGVSLTIARKKGNAFTVALIPHTRAVTNLSRLEVGARVNVETDILARYVANFNTKR
jgi:riboflavin synthase